MTEWNVTRRPGLPLRRTDDRFVLPLTVSRGGETAGVAEWVLTAVEAEQLHAALCYALDGRPVPDVAPECRTQGRRGPWVRY